MRFSNNLVMSHKNIYRVYFADTELVSRMELGSEQHASIKLLNLLENKRSSPFARIEETDSEILFWSLKSKVKADDSYLSVSTWRPKSIASDFHM